MKLTAKGFRSGDWKHLIERWCGRYISDDDVQVAALMHPNIQGKFPSLNIGKRLVLPNERRLKSIRQAGAHSYESASGDRYAHIEA
ncbi:hypothetical protein [Aliiroseovarius sp. YM-037]|uniref:hypothetical protein n=1 Tax=Aliiroseovarius sp. YM-037 TaxID=3341728 RepID=UPI003A801098